MNPDASKDQKTFFAKFKNLFTANHKLGGIPKDLSPEDVIELFDLQPDQIPPRINEKTSGIPSHIKVENEVHLSHPTPKDFYTNKEKKGNENSTG